MKILTKLSSLVLLLIFLVVPQTTSKSQVGIKSFGIEGGWYIPQMDYWNQETFIQNWADQFEGGIYGRGFIEFKLVGHISTRVGVGYWSQTRTQADIPWGQETRTDEIEFTLIPFTMDIIAGLPMESFPPLSLYGGIGWGINFIQMKYSRTPSVSAAIIDENSGQDYLGNLLAGINIPITPGLAAALEFRYVFGQYVQQFSNTGGDVINSKISVGGPQITLALKYMFDE